MASLQITRIMTIQSLTDGSSIDPSLMKSILKSFVQEYLLESEKDFEPFCVVPLPHPNRISQRECTPPRRLTVGPPKWNTLVSPFTGVAMDGSDGQMHAPLPRNMPPMTHECYVARSYLENIPYFLTRKDLECEARSRKYLVAIMQQAYNEIGSCHPFLGDE